MQFPAQWLNQAGERAFVSAARAVQIGVRPTACSRSLQRRFAHPTILPHHGESTTSEHHTALAATLGIEPTLFPGGHIGSAEDPDAFATGLRTVLHGD